MNQQPLFTVATLGFDERERVMLRDAFRVSEHLSPVFRTLVKDARALPHIVIVNADHADAVTRWESFRRANEGKGKLPTLMWSAKPQAGAHKYTLERPATLTQLFAVLERIVTEEHGYAKPATTSGAPELLSFSSPEVALVAATPVAAPVPPPSATVSRPANDVAHVATVVIPKQTAAAIASSASDAPDFTIAHPESTVTPSAASARLTPNSAERVGAIARPESAIPLSAASALSAVGAQSAANNGEEIAVIMEPPTLAPPASITPAPTSSAGSEPAAPRTTFQTRAAAPQSRFLVVDDSLPVRIQMKEALKTYAKTIDFAHSGEEAMFLIDNCKYDVIFLDVILPGKDGYEVCRYIRSHALQRQTPVIMLTGNSSPADRVKGKLAGCDTYLIKPVRASVLSEIISEFTKSSAVA